MDNSKNISFFAMLHRMKYIERWGLMRNTERENLKEHTFDVALLAHALVEIRRVYFPQLKPQLKPGDVVLYALYHDASEIITGDMPTPVKYFNPRMRSQYQEVEEHAMEYLLSLLPPEMSQQYAQYFDLSEKKSTLENNSIDYESKNKADQQFAKKEKEHIKKLIKEADVLSAYIKCLEEIKQGNHEFMDAAVSTRKKLSNKQSCELKWFLDNILPAYELNLDQLGPHIITD